MSFSYDHEMINLEWMQKRDYWNFFTRYLSVHSISHFMRFYRNSLY